MCTCSSGYSLPSSHLVVLSDLAVERVKKRKPLFRSSKTIRRYSSGCIVFFIRKPSIHSCPSSVKYRCDKLDILFYNIPMAFFRNRQDYLQIQQMKERLGEQQTARRQREREQDTEHLTE